MRSYRSRPVGWRQDFHRHYLAAKYGSAGRTRYLSSTNDGPAKAAAMLKATFGDGRPETEDFSLRAKHRDIESKGADVKRRLDEAKKEGVVSAKRADEFYGGKFTDITKDYLDNTYDSEQYKAEVDKSLQSHLHEHATSVKPFDYTEKKEESPDVKHGSLGATSGIKNPFLAQRPSSQSLR
jgi:hypothetical protein